MQKSIIKDYWLFRYFKTHIGTAAQQACNKKNRFYI